MLIRTRMGMLAEAMPRIRQEIAGADNAILESNSILEFLEPDLYLTVLDPAVADFKDSARRWLNRADAILISSRTPSQSVPRALADAISSAQPRFPIAPPQFMSEEIVEFVRAKLHRVPCPPADALTR